MLLKAAPSPTATSTVQQEAEDLAFETVKFNLLWSKMKEAEERSAPELPQLKKEVASQGKILEQLGGSLPAEMLTVEQAAERAAKLRQQLTFDNLMQMTGEERWLLAQSLGPAFPIALVLSYTLYWALNVPLIAYAYFTTVVTGQTTMALVMAGAYATSIPFKPLIYIGGLLGTPWTADNIMPWVGKLVGYFRPPSDDEWSDLLR